MLTPKRVVVWGGLGAVAVAALLLSVRASGDQPSGASSSKTSNAFPASPGKHAEERNTPRLPHTPSRANGTQQAAPPIVSPTAPEDVAPGADPLRSLRAAKRDPSDVGTRQLLSMLKSQDAVVVAEAANELVERRATQAIRTLATVELRDAGGSGLSIIDALGRLGEIAKSGEKTEAIERLLALLASEKQRGAPESAGNLLQLYEALGRTRDERAAGALEAELLDPQVGRAPKVVIVQSLVWIEASSSRAALVEARKLQSELPPADDFDAELRVELLGVIEAAIAAL